MVFSRTSERAEAAGRHRLDERDHPAPAGALLLLENLEPAEKITRPVSVKPAVEFDGSEGTAVTGGYSEEPQNFNDFLIDAGIDPDGIEVIPPVRTSRWQQQKDGELVWLTSYRFTFRKKTSDGIDLPILMREAERGVKKRQPKQPTDRALVVCWSDLQVGKVDYRGNSASLIERVERTAADLIEMIKKDKPERVIFADVGDTVENFYNANAPQQNYSNDLSIMEQVDVATTLAWRTIRALAEHVPKVTYASVGSNHCQFRMNGKAIGKPTDDWGVFIGRQLARLASEVGITNVSFREPQPQDETLAIDVFDDNYHILGIAHGHQARRPDLMATWWRQQAFGHQPVAAATTLVHGHFHHLRITEMGSNHNGTSRFLVMAPTMDNGSNWFRMVSGEDSIPGLAVFYLNKGEPFTGTVYKL